MPKVSKKGKDDNKKAEKGLNSGMTGSIRDVLKETTWPNWKFLTNHKQLNNLCQQVMTHLSMASLTGNSAGAVLNRQNWCDKCADFVLSEMNKQKTCVSTRMQKYAWTWMESNGGKLPEIAVIATINDRSIVWDDSDEHTKKIILWYVDNMMPQFGQTGKFFSERVRYYQMISRAITDPNVGIDMTCGTEAFGMTTYHNNKVKWESHFEAKIGKTHMKICTHKNEIKVKEPKTLYLDYGKNKNYETLWSNNEAGQNKFNGWEKAGIDAWIAYRKANYDGRRTPNRSVLEKAILAQLRLDNNITEETPELQAEKKKAKPKKTPKIDPEKGIDLDFEEEDLADSD